MGSKHLSNESERKNKTNIWGEQKKKAKEDTKNTRLDASESLIKNLWLGDVSSAAL